MSTAVPIKSILKQPKSTSPFDDQNAKADQDKRNLSIALNHAHRIEAQKETQRHILHNIETLLDIPSSSTPTASEGQAFATLVHPFQPSDFAALVEERRVAERCGYALCPRRPRSLQLGASAGWKLKGRGAGDFCSTACVRKALYVQAQLSGVPAWEREHGQQAPIVLPVGDGMGSGMMTGGREGVEGDVAVAGGEELAAERGEEVTSFRPRQVMMESVVEKPRSRTAGAPAFPRGPTTASYGAIEGYEPRYSSQRDEEGDSDDAEAEEGGARTVGFGSEVMADEDDMIDPEEEAAWRELQTGLKHLNTSHDR